MSTPLEIWRAGFVNRWHTHSDLSGEVDFTCAHAGRVVALVLAFFPDASRNLLAAAATHDMGEYASVDILSPVKHRNPALAEEARKIEAEYLAALGLSFPLDPVDSLRLDLCDRIDGYLFAGLRRPHLLKLDAWRAMRSGLVATAERLEGFDHVSLGLSDRVELMLEAAAKGGF